MNLNNLRVFLDNALEIHWGCNVVANLFGKVFQMEFTNSLHVPYNTRLVCNFLEVTSNCKTRSLVEIADECVLFLRKFLRCKILKKKSQNKAFHPPNSERGQRESRIS